MPRVFRALDRQAKQCLCSIIESYRYCISPNKKACCRFFPSCSVYALDVLRTKPTPVAIGHIIWRLLRCHPFSKGGLDLPPQ